MAKNESTRLRPVQLAEDEAAYNALQNLAGYAPANASHSVAAVTQEFDRMRAAHTAEDQASAAQATARDFATAREWAVHNLILAVKDSVRAQFGKDSPQVQEIGLKRKSEYKSPKRKSSALPK